jgi:hypothetical protein
MKCENAAFRDVPQDRQGDRDALFSDRHPNVLQKCGVPIVSVPLECHLLLSMIAAFRSTTWFARTIFYSQF